MTYSAGLKSNRDAWVYNFSEAKLCHDVETAVDFYNDQVAGFTEHCQVHGISDPTDADVDRFIDTDPKKFSWNRADKGRARRGDIYAFDEARLFNATYRPFMRQRVYYSGELNDMIYQLPKIFPTPEHRNFGFY
jgi:predicted helicase